MANVKNIERLQEAVDEINSAEILPYAKESSGITLANVAQAVDRAAYRALQFLEMTVGDRNASVKERILAASVILREGGNFLRFRGSILADDSVLF